MTTLTATTTATTATTTTAVEKSGSAGKSSSTTSIQFKRNLARKKCPHGWSVVHFCNDVIVQGSAAGYEPLTFRPKPAGLPSDTLQASLVIHKTNYMLTCNCSGAANLLELRARATELTNYHRNHDSKSCASVSWWLDRRSWYKYHSRSLAAPVRHWLWKLKQKSQSISNVGTLSSNQKI